MSDNVILRAAMRYLSGESPFGRPVAAIPCCRPDAESASGCTAPWHQERRDHKPGKTPLVPWKQYQARLPTEDDWRAWWAQWGGRCNIGCLAGAVSGVLLLDIDAHDAAADGRQTIREQGLAVPATPTVKTPGGGLHAWYSYPAGVEPGTLRNFQAKATLPGIDARGDGGFAVLPPSLHLSGGAYQWATETRALPLAPCPLWLRAAFQRRGGAPPEGRGAAAPDEWADLWRGPWTPGQRHGVANRLIGHLREHGHSEAEAVALLVQWDATACRPPKGEGETVAHVHDVFLRYSADEGDIAPAPAEQAVAAIARLPLPTRRALASANARARCRGAADALRAGMAPGALLAVLLDVGAGDLSEARHILRWATNVAATQEAAADGWCAV